MLYQIVPTYFVIGRSNEDRGGTQDVSSQKTARRDWYV